MAGRARFQRAGLPRWLVLMLASCALFAAGGARAQVGSHRYSSIVIEASSGTVISAVNADQPRYPASLVKVMTLYMVFEAVRDRRISLGQLVPISAHAASMEPTKLGLMPGSQITVEQAILGLITKSANDAAAALAELLGGTEDRFAQMMTLRARSLGMANTTFQNASGLPDSDQVSTARDMAILSRRLIADFPSYYRYFATPSFVWHHRTVYNHHRLLQSYPGADGLKTGYTHASGYNLISSAVRGGVRLIGVVMGASTSGERNNHMTALLTAAYDHLDVPIERKPPPSRGLIISAAQAQPADPPPRQTTRARAPALNWGIQVGSFSAERPARDAAFAARRAVGSGEAHVDAATIRKKPIWRAQVTGLTENDAEAACHSMARKKASCLPFRIEGKQVAAR